MVYTFVYTIEEIIWNGSCDLALEYRIEPYLVLSPLHFVQAHLVQDYLVHQLYHLSNTFQQRMMELGINHLPQTPQTKLPRG